MTEYFVTHSEVMAVYTRFHIFVCTVKWNDMNDCIKATDA
jgi:hypothetical protein